MAVIKRILKHVGVEIARGDRRCRRDASHTIRPGNRCLTIQDDGTPFKRSYCAECALPILKLCATELRGIRDGLYPHGLPIARPVAEPTVGEALVAKNRRSRKKQTEETATAETAISPETPVSHDRSIELPDLRKFASK